MVPVPDGPRRTEHVAWGSFNPSPAARTYVEHVKESIALHTVDKYRDLSINILGQYT